MRGNEAHFAQNLKFLLMHGFVVEFRVIVPFLPNANITMLPAVQWGLLTEWRFVGECWNGKPPTIFREILQLVKSDLIVLAQREPGRMHIAGAVEVYKALRARDLAHFYQVLHAFLFNDALVPLEYSLFVIGQIRFFPHSTPLFWKND
jgi:hypothetical protein